MGEEKVQEKLFTLEEVALKTSPDSYMLVIHNKVYDVTNFISEVYSYTHKFMCMTFGVLIIYSQFMPYSIQEGQRYFWML